jgi:hypothetical protein
MRFVYQKPGEPEREFALKLGWRESGKYLHGIDASDDTLKTFLKHRVLRYIGGVESRLSDPFPSPPPKPEPRGPSGPEILFTGFASLQRASLEAKTRKGGFVVVNSVTKGLAYLCAGPNAGPAKVAKSREANVFILTEPQLHIMLATGELPDEDDRY